MRPPDRSREPTDNRITIHQMGASISTNRYLHICAIVRLHIFFSVSLIIMDWNNVITTGYNILMLEELLFPREATPTTTQNDYQVPNHQKAQ